MKTSVIIPTYNRAQTLRATVESLIEQEFDRTQYEILVVDNNSTDQTGAVVRELQARSPVQLRYLHEPRPGVHYARNFGAIHARGDLLYFTDDDMVATPGMLGELLRLVALDPLIATATGRVLPKWQCDPPEWVLEQCQNELLSLQFRSEELMVASYDMGVYSCHQAIRKAALLECGGFNPENTGGIWVGDGETGLGLKLKARGYKFAYTSRAVTYHMIPQARMTQSYLRRRMSNQGSADAYTSFRATKPDDAQLARNQLRCLLDCGVEALRSLRAYLRGRSAWRVHIARLNYHMARFHFTRRLRRDESWRGFVLRDDWIDRMVKNDAGEEVPQEHYTPAAVVRSSTLS